MTQSHSSASSRSSWKNRSSTIAFPLLYGKTDDRSPVSQATELSARWRDTTATWCGAGKLIAALLALLLRFACSSAIFDDMVTLAFGALLHLSILQRELPYGPLGEY